MARIGRVFDSTRFSQTIRCMAHMGVAASFLSVLIVAGGCQQKEQAGPPPVPVVEVVKVVQQDVPIFSEWIGVLDGSINAVIRPQVTGYLVKQNYVEGDIVRKGQVLFEIDPRTFQAEVKQAQAALEQAKGELAAQEASAATARADLARIKPLAAKNAVSQKDLDYAIGRDLVAKVNHLRQVLADHGCADKPFFCTEVGAPSGPTPFYDPAPTQESQARYVTQVAARAVAARLDAMIWFAWKDFTDNAMYEHYGLVTSTRVEKSSVLAFRTATLKLGSATFVRTLDFPGVEAYEFRTPSGATLVTLWSDDGLSRTVTLQAARATLTDMYGTPQGEVTDAGDGTADGQIVVTAGANPLYVEIPHAQ